MSLQRGRIDLLNTVQDVHRRDIQAYVSRHLSNVKSSECSSLSRNTPSWASSTISPVKLKPASHPVNLPVRKGEFTSKEKKMKTMINTVAEFGFGALGGVMLGGRIFNGDMYNKENGEEIQQIEKTTFVEELKLPEIMLQPKKKKCFRKVKNISIPEKKREFYKGHLGYVTKSDQYGAMKNFERTVVNLPDASDKGLLTGERVVRKIQNSLNKKIRGLQDTQRRGPNFHRLQAYSESFNEIIDQSTTFSRLLKMIKDEYDSYLAHILDQNNVSQHRELIAQMPSLSKAKSIADNVEHQRKTLKNLEEDAVILLDENERLRKCLKEEKQKPFVVKPQTSENGIKIRRHVEEFPKDFQEQVEDLHSQIADQLQTLEKMKKYQREHCVPASVCQHFEHCIKETDVDIQKLLKQNEFLEQSIEELEAELETLLSPADSSGREQWKKKLDISKIIQYGKSKDKEK